MLNAAQQLSVFENIGSRYYIQLGL